MIKKSTLFILIGAIALGAAVYYFDWKRGEKDAAKSAEETSKLAFNIPAGSEIVSLVLARPQMAGEAPVHLEKQNGEWQILQPIQTGADQQRLGTIVDTLGSARIEATELGAPDRLKAYGLDPPAISLEFKLRNGAQHTLKIGNKDFTNSYVYGVIDGAKDVALLPTALLIQTDLPVSSFRDPDVLHISVTDVNSFSLENPAGAFEAKKVKEDWTFAKPDSGKAADDADVTSLLSAVAEGKVAGIASETPEGLSKYGLSSPAITFTASETNGKSATLIVGKKDADLYYAKDVSRPTIFKINDTLYKKLAVSYRALRDKKFVQVTQPDLTRAELHNANGTVVATSKSGEEWVAEAPPEIKGKSIATWKLLTPVITARADEIVDAPSVEVLSKLAKPFVQEILTEKDGHKLTVSLTAAIGDFVYGRSSESPTVYKFKKDILNDLNSKVADFAF